MGDEVDQAARLADAKVVSRRGGEGPFAKLCAKTPYAEMHRVEGSNLLYCMEHLADIMEMRAGWTPSERAKINHPTSMAQRLRAFLNRAPTEAPRRNVSPLALPRDKKEQLERANLDLAEQVAALQARDGQGSLFDLHRSNADEIAATIVFGLGRCGAARLAQEAQGASGGLNKQINGNTEWPPQGRVADRVGNGSHVPVEPHGL